MTTEHYYTIEELKQLPTDFYPMMVFADNVKSIISLGIKLRTKSYYGHFMWYVGIDRIASQGIYFKEHKLSDYNNFAMKFVCNPNWTHEEKMRLINEINRDLSKPWYKTLYDIIGVFGKFLGLDWLNIKCLNFCSERGKYLKLIDNEFELRNPTPSELNEYTKLRQYKYQVYGRYTPD